ncbi:MAG: GNAT family N-acetyltransferase [bacterium]
MLQKDIPKIGRVIIRPIAEGDEEPLSKFYRSLSDDTVKSFQSFRTSDISTMKRVVREAVEGLDWGLVALNDRGNIIAHAFLKGIDDDVPTLGIGVLDGYQGCGLGSLMMGELIERGRKLGKAAIRLTVVKDNSRAIHVYRKFGFEITGEASFRSLKDSYEMRVDISRERNSKRFFEDG